MFRRAFRLVGLVAVAAAVVIVVAALTTWWVLLALMPLMMVGCMAMMSVMPSMDAWRPERWGRMMGFDGWWGGRRESATEILERRFAEGAISVEDYRERREVIAGDRRRRGAAGEQRAERAGEMTAEKATHTLEERGGASADVAERN